MSENTNEARAINRIFNGSSFVDIEDLSILTQANQQLANAIATGPQDEFFEELEKANQTIRRYANMNHYGYTNYGANDDTSFDLNVTPSWNWKAKTHDKIRDLTFRILSMHKKANGIDKFVQRTKDMAYRLSHIETSFQKLENLKRYLKREGYSANVDIEEYKEKLTDFASKVRDECDKVTDYGQGNISIEPYINIPENERHSKFYLIIKIEKLTMNIYQEDTLVQELSLYPIYIVFSSDLRKMMKYLANPTSSNIRVDYKGIYDSPVYPEYSRRSSHVTEHPYISAPGYNMSSRLITYSTVCFDKYTDDVRNSFHRLDYMSMILNIMSWAQYYNTNYANPYNQPTMLHLGMSETFSKSYQALFPDKSIDCSTRMRNKWSLSQDIVFSNPYLSKIDKIRKECNSIKCVWRHLCGFNLENSLTLEEIANNHELRFQIESVLGWLEESQNASVLDEILESDFGISHLLLYHDEVDLEPIINTLIARNTNFYRILRDFQYWGKIDNDSKTTSFPEGAINEQETQENMLRWATERGM